MDTSKEYIWMCQQAKEIQEKYSATEGDYLIYTDKPGEVWIFPNDLRIREGTFDWELIWLPRQDQLQDMFGRYEYGDHIYNMYRWTRARIPHGHITNEYARSMKSMEQLWFAFIMGKKYNKVWNGEDWVSA